jgi:hypothetical protein
LSAPSGRFWQQTAICPVSLWASVVEPHLLNWTLAQAVRRINPTNSLCKWCRLCDKARKKKRRGHSQRYNMAQGRCVLDNEESETVRIRNIHCLSHRNGCNANAHECYVYMQIACLSTFPFNINFISYRSCECHIAHLQQECHNSKFVILELLL